MQNAINEGTKEDTKREIITPLVHLSKAQIVEEAIKLNVPLELTWSLLQRRGKACGVCDSCRLLIKWIEKKQTRKIQ